MRLVVSRDTSVMRGVLRSKYKDENGVQKKRGKKYKTGIQTHQGRKGKNDNAIALQTKPKNDEKTNDSIKTAIYKIKEMATKTYLKQGK